jgi:hypothetical protein
MRSSFKIYFYTRERAKFLKISIVLKVKHNLQVNSATMNKKCCCFVFLFAKINLLHKFSRSLILTLLYSNFSIN